MGGLADRRRISGRFVCGLEKKRDVIWGGRIVAAEIRGPGCPGKPAQEAACVGGG
jgi:hypothetical protein